MSTSNLALRNRTRTMRAKTDDDGQQSGNALFAALFRDNYGPTRDSSYDAGGRVNYANTDICRVRNTDIVMLDAAYDDCNFYDEVDEGDEDEEDDEEYDDFGLGADGTVLIDDNAKFWRTSDFMYSSVSWSTPSSDNDESDDDDDDNFDVDRIPVDACPPTSMTRRAHLEGDEIMDIDMPSSTVSTPPSAPHALFFLKQESIFMDGVQTIRRPPPECPFSSTARELGEQERRRHQYLQMQMQMATASGAGKRKRRGSTALEVAEQLRVQRVRTTWWE
ncbi:uncharacterized protein V1518DRAFT_253391 [Limtongia smithiae]|uniref:uncharacterized protein n=1 Tax=Limtongia smithiae TaxID=1125753 RepID=UPI0034CD72C3